MHCTKFQLEINYIFVIKSHGNFIIKYSERLYRSKSSLNNYYCTSIRHKSIESEQTRILDNLREKIDLFWKICIIVSEESTTVAEKNRWWPHALLKPWQPAVRQLDLGSNHQLRRKERSYRSVREHLQKLVAKYIYAFLIICLISS